MWLRAKLQQKQGKVWILCAFAIGLGLVTTMKTLAEAPAENKTTAKFQNPEQDPGLVTAQRQITFQGPRSGEGYFSRDGKHMIFQSEREAGNPFYQIYLMNLKTGKTTRVSTGTGKTTCAWIYPTQQKVMFASTHLDANFKDKVQQELESRKSQQKGKYSWSYDENFDIFETDWTGKNIKRLTTEKGYDAEGDYSPDGKKIVFASNRSGYTETLSPEDQKLFEQDPSYMMDIYVMNADGTGVKRLTNVKGYDGGPFWSADGKKITWRRFAPNGQSAEIYTMNADGSEQAQITKLGAMSWAPYFHPSGDYLIMTTNVLGFSNFELFIVDAKGEKDPVRVTYLDGFDGLPVFTPDGQHLSWTRRNEKGESQIYMADWDDAKARELLGLSSPAPVMEKMASSKEINTTDLKAWVNYLASEKLAGRLTGSAEEVEYTHKLAEAFKTLGLVPGEGKDFIVPFTFTSGVTLGANNSLVLKEEKKEFSFRANEDFVPLSFSKTGEFAAAPIVFAGYGIKAPASDTQSAYDSYKNLDVKGKWVLIFRDIPENIPNERRIFLNRYSALHHKAMAAKNEGAAGLLIVGSPKSSSQKLVRLRYDGANSESSIPVFSISTTVAETLVQPTKKKLTDWQEQNDSGEIHTGEIEKLQLSAKVDLNFQKSEGHNVIAKLAFPGAKTSVMIGAHGDHLGRGEMGNSLAKEGEQGHIHYGADDNASGVAAVMEIAKVLSAQKKAGKLNLKQNLLFGVWSGEEAGLLGSTNFLKDRKGEKITSYLNMDMIGRLREQVLVQGVGSASEWRGKLETVAASSDVGMSQQEDPYVPSDGMQFYVQGIPSITFFTGSHAEYHSPRDRASTLNYVGLQKIANLVETMGVNLASDSKALTYQKVESSHRKLEGRGFRIFLGTIPDYTQEGVKGVKISGTSKDSPAEKAGLKAGDVILELNSAKIENLYDYVYCLQAMKANVETPLKVSRKGQILDLKIVPALKE